MAISKFAKKNSLFKTTLSSGMQVADTTMTLQAVPTGNIQYPNWMVIEPDSANAEIVYLPTAPSGTTYSGVIRFVSKSLDTDAAGTGIAHAANVDVVMPMTHRDWNDLAAVMQGTNGTGYNNFRVGDETASDIKFYAQNAMASKPFITYQQSTGKWLISNDGVSTYDITAGGSGLSAGAGISIAASAITTLLNASGLLVKNLGAGSNELGIATPQAQALAGSFGTPGPANLFVTQTDPALPPTGSITMYAGNTAPTSWLLCNGAAVSRATYAALFAILSPTIGTFTITIAAPGVVTQTAHGLATGDSVYLTTTGALPTGLTANTRYWITKIDANSYKFATSLANALVATNITTTGSQSGVHTAKGCAYGLGDGSTTFNVPSMLGSVVVGKDQSQSEFAGLGQTGGEKTHVLTAGEIAAHSHTQRGAVIGGAAGGNSTMSLWQSASNQGSGLQSQQNTDNNTPADGAHNNLQPYLAVNFIIKT